MYTQDAQYVEDLAVYHKVQVRIRGRWVWYRGVLPTHDEAFDVEDTSPYMTADYEDENSEGIEEH